MSSHFHKTLFFSSSALALYTMHKHSLFKGENKHLVSTERFNSVPYTQLPSRCEQLKSLQTVTEYDILIIGGGVVGSGIALDSISRGLKTALVELDDFSSGTSSRSTKLIHGGVRYLQKAIMHFDVEQYRMVKEALHERANLLAIAPHLSYPLPVMLPVYTWWKVPYFWIGMKMYDFVAGKKVLKSSYFLSYDKVLELFPLLKKENLCGALVYYDGQHNDARMNLSILMTAARMGANIANHVEAVNLLKSVDTDGKEKVCGARVKDMQTGREWDIHAKSVINATGPFTDCVRRMDDDNCSIICQPSAGVHIVLPEYYCPKNMGLLDPSTSDGRVLFFLPWQKMTIAGTTDKPCELTFHPTPSEEEVQFILNTIKNYLSPEITVRRSDVMSAWSGIRPLICDPKKSCTQELARNHVISISDSNLITITGGKWTTYRIMAKDAVDTAVKICNLHPKSECQTDGLLLEGAKGWTPNMYIKLIQDYGMEVEVAQHLANTYGDQAFAVAKLASMTDKKWPILGQRLHKKFPYIKAEVYYAINEYACTAIDVIARRLRLSFLDVEAAEEILPTVITIMADILKWSKVRRKEEYEKAKKFLFEEMGGNIKLKVFLPCNLPEEEINVLTKKFETIDTNKKGYVTFAELKMHLEVMGENVDDETVHNILSESSLSKNEEIKLEDYLHLMSAIKSGVVSRLMTTKHNIRSAKSVERSGGGV